MVRKGVGKFERTGDRGALDSLLLFLARVFQLLSVGIDGGVASGCGLGVRRISVSRALILLGSLAEVLILEEKVCEPEVDGGRLAIRREGLQIVAVPSEGLVIIGKFLVRVLRALILSVIMRREVLQVCFEIGDRLRR